MRTIFFLFLLGLSLATLAGCATVGGYAIENQPKQWVVDSETAFKYMENPKIKGNKILFEGKTPPDGEYDICLINKDGSGFVNLTPQTPGMRDRFAKWIEGGIAYWSRKSGSNEKGQNYTMNEDGSNKRPVSEELYNSLPDISENK